MKITLQTLALAVAVAMSAFAGGLATFGLANFVPGANGVVFVMGALFEVGQLVAFATLHRHWGTMSRGLKYGLGFLAVVVVVLDVVGVAGQLSQAYQGRVNDHQAAVVALSATIAAKLDAADAEVAALDRQIAAIDAAIVKAGEARIKARDDRDRVKAAKAIVTEAETKRVLLVTQRNDVSGRVVVLKSEAGQAAGRAVAGTGEFAAVKFVAASLGWSEDAVTRALIFVISALPNLFALSLVMAAGHLSPKALPIEVKKTLAKRSVAARRGWMTRRRKQAQKTGPRLVGPA
jgi:hypothetical protein